MFTVEDVAQYILSMKSILLKTMSRLSFPQCISMSESDKPWIFYLIQNGNATYAGVSPDPTRRLRQHNSEIAGGAKYTTSNSPNWSHMCLVSGFQTKQQSMQFEWAVKHVPPRNAGGPFNRLRKLYTTLNKSQWTSKSPLSSTVPLNVEWLIPKPENIGSLPAYVTETFPHENDE